MGKILLTAGLLLILSVLIFNQEAAEAAPDGRSSEESKSGENKSGKNDSKHSGSGDDDDHSKENSDEDDCDFDDDDDDDRSGHHKKDSREDSGEQKKKKPHDGSGEDKRTGSHENSGEHHKKDKKHHCRNYNDTLSPDELVILQYILVFLQTQDEGCTGYILFKGKYISVDFIFTFIYIRGGNTSQLTVDGLWKIIQIYRAREQHSSSDGSEYHISKGNLITLQYILLCIERNRYSDQGKIEYNGYFISIQDLKYYSDQNSINFTRMTVEQLLFIINIYKQDKDDTTSPGIPLGPEPTEDQNTVLEIIIRFLQTQGNNPYLVFTFYGYKINTTSVISCLQRENMDIKHINSETLWKIIKLITEYSENRNGQNSGENNEVTPSPDEEKQLQNIVLFLQHQGEGTTGDIQFEGHSIPIDFILTYLFICGDSTQELNDTVVWSIIQLYLHLQSNSSSSGSTSDVNREHENTLKYILYILKTNQSSSSGKIVFNGSQIPVEYIRNVFRQEHKDIQKLTSEGLLDIINNYIREHGNNSQQGKPLGSEPTQEQITQLNYILNILQGQRSDSNFVFTFEGYKIPARYVFTYLREHDMTIQKISSHDLWNIILQYVSSETTGSSTTPETTATPTPGGQLTEEERRELENALQVLESQRSDANGVFEFNGYNISYQSIIAYMREHNIGYENLTTIYNLYEIVTQIIYVQDQYQNVTFQNFLKMIQDPSQVPNLTLVYNGCYIPVQNIVNDLGLKIDSDTGMYDTGGVTAKQLFDVLDKYECNAQTTTEGD